VDISYLKNNGDPGAQADNRMIIDSTVQWLDKTQKTVLLHSVITDHLGRENLFD